MRLYPAFHVEALPRKIETALLGGPDRVRLVVGRVRMGRCDRRGRADRDEGAATSGQALRRIAVFVFRTPCLPLGITELC